MFLNQNYTELISLILINYGSWLLQKKQLIICSLAGSIMAGKYKKEFWLTVLIKDSNYFLKK